MLSAAELLAIIKWKTLHKPIHPRNKSKESFDVQECYRFLELTSRSFVAVCQELHPELLMPVIIFYLVLRALDTIEDDMTLDIQTKIPLLRNFDTHLHDTNWTFDGSGPHERDREVLVKFDCVAREFNRLKEEYRIIIKDICKGMGNGMADYAELAEKDPNGISVKTIKDYELYCHHVAGLVGEGLTRLFVEAGFVDPRFLEEIPEPMESMGQMLQHTNIIRDVREDYDDKRYFWPEEVWSKYVPSFDALFLPQNREKALQCSSEMILMALTRSEDCLVYMAGVKEQSTFNFTAIPQTMAIATLELCFQNPALFERNIKISKGSACQIMLESTKDLQSVGEVFRRFARKIIQKNNPKDPHYAEINIACGKIEKFVESRFPEAARIKAQEAETRRILLYILVALVGIFTAMKWLQ